MKTLIERLNWRYATKKYDPARRIPQETVHRIVEAVRLAPSSSGLQPYELRVVTNPALREKLRAVAWDQAQITESSHLVVFAAWDDITPERVNMMFDLTNAVRGFENPGWEAYRCKLLSIVADRGPHANFEAAARQAYIGLGCGLVAAAMEEIDATPMEGFDPEAVGEILGLQSLGLRAVVLMALGYRAEEGDWLVDLPKVRRGEEAFVTFIG